MRIYRLFMPKTALIYRSERINISRYLFRCPTRKTLFSLWRVAASEERERKRERESSIEIGTEGSAVTQSIDLIGFERTLYIGAKR